MPWRLRSFIFGLPSNAVINRLAEPAMQRACALWAEVQAQEVVPDAVRLAALSQVSLPSVQPPLLRLPVRWPLPKRLAHHRYYWYALDAP